MSDNPKHVTVRLRVPPELRDKIADSANAHNRSMNADMVALLQEEITLAMKDVMKSIASNAVNNLLEQGVDENVVKNAFTSKPK